MRKYTLLAALLLAVVLATVAVVQGQPQSVDPLYGNVIDYAPVNPRDNTQYTEAVPRVMVHYNTTSGGVAGLGVAGDVPSQISSFLVRGIPVTLSIRADFMDVAGRLTWAKVRELRELADKHGTVLHIAQGTNGAMTELRNLGGAYPEAGYDYTYEDLVDDLDPTEIVNRTGYRPRAITVPNENGAMEWIIRNRPIYDAVADSLGYWWTQVRGTAPQDTVGQFVYWPSTTNMDGATNRIATVTDRPYPGYTKPGWVGDPHMIPSTVVDLGELVVERTDAMTGANYAPADTFYGYGGKNFTGVEPPDTDEWTLTGNGADANNSGINNKTWASFYAKALAGGAGFSVELADSAASIGSAASTLFTGITNGEYQAGASSPEHIAWTLAMLESKGLIKLVGVEEYNEWAMGSFAALTNLVWTREPIMSQFAIGDTLGATSEYPWIAGWSTLGTGTLTQVTGPGLLSYTTEQTGNVAKYDRTAYPNPYEIIVENAGPYGAAVQVVDVDNSDAVASPVFQFPGLADGRYRLEIPWRQSAGTSFAMGDVHERTLMRSWKIGGTNRADFVTAWGDTLLAPQWHDAGTTGFSLNTNFANRWGTVPVHFSFGDLAGFPLVDFDDSEIGGDKFVDGWWDTSFKSNAYGLRFASVASGSPTQDNLVGQIRLIYLGK